MIDYGITIRGWDRLCIHEKKYFSPWTESVVPYYLSLVGLVYEYGWVGGGGSDKYYMTRALVGDNCLQDRK